jgi:hypothetical protein
VALCGVVALAAGALEMVSTRAEARSETQSRTVQVLPAAPNSVELERFALNALLVPLLDDDWPPRWTDVAVEHFCGPDTRVTIDGLPLRPGAPMPATAFTVRWQMERCMPMGFETPELSGEVELHVSHADGGLSALVLPQGLAVATPAGRSWLTGPLTARMSLGGPAEARHAAARRGG